MLNIPNGEYYNLNAVASVIWKHFDVPKTFHSIVNVLQEKYDVSIEQCGLDTQNFIIELIEKGLISIVDEKVK